MNVTQFFLEQYDTVRMMIDETVFARLSDEQLRHSPREGQNSRGKELWVPSGCCELRHSPREGQNSLA